METLETPLDPPLRTTDLRQELRASAQLSRAPFGTCCRVGTWDLRMVGRDGSISRWSRWSPYEPRLASLV